MARGGDGTSSAPCGLFKGRGVTLWGCPSPLSPSLQSLVGSQGGEFPICPWLKLGRAGPRSASRRSVVRVGSCKDQCVSWSFVLSARMVHCSQVLLWCSLSPGVTLGQHWWCCRSGVCPRGAQLPRGWRKLKGAVPEPKVAAGLCLWERHRQAQPGSHTVPVPFK